MMMPKDPRRERPIAVKQERQGLYRLRIDDELWASVEWSRGRNAWCIEDSCNRCLTHVPGILGQEETAAEAITTAKQMIRDETIPAPEYVKARTRGNR
jgi:hypothetical protein